MSKRRCYPCCLLLLSLSSSLHPFRAHVCVRFSTSWIWAREGKWRGRRQEWEWKKCEMNACMYRLGLPYLIQRLTGVLLTRVKACSKKATFYVRNGFQKSNSKITHQQHQVWPNCVFFSRMQCTFINHQRIPQTKASISQYIIWLQPTENTNFCQL